MKVDDLACVGEMGLQMFDKLTVSSSCLNGGMLSKNRNDGSDSDEKYKSAGSNQIDEISAMPAQNNGSSQVELSPTEIIQTSNLVLNNSRLSHESS